MRPDSTTSLTRLLLMAALATGSALRLFRLGSESFWYDEAVSVFLATKSVPDLVAHTARDIHPPGYYLLLHLWGLAVRPTLLHGLEFLYAWISAASGVAILAILYPIGKRLVGDRAALVGVWVATLHPFHLWYSQEVRMYAPGALIGLLCLYATLRWVEEGRRRWLALYAVCAAGGLYLFYYFAFVLVGIGLAAAVLTPTLRRWGGWALSHLLVLLLYLPWLEVFWRQATEPPVPPWREAWSSWNAAGTAAQEALAAALVGQTPLGPLWIGAVLVVAASVVAVVLAPARRRLLALLMGMAGPVALLLLVTAFVTPLYHVRYLFPMLVAFPLVLGSLIMALWEQARWAGAVAAAALAVLSIAGLRAYWSDPLYRADDHRAAVAMVAAQWRPGDVILANAGWVYPLLEVYWPREAEADGAVPAELDAPVRLLDAIEDEGAFEVGRVPVVRGGSVDGDPSLGWCDPQSDFFAISREETERGLEALAARFTRLWHYRLYDTVSDPAGVMRNWFDRHTPLVRDEAIPGRDFGRIELRESASASAPVTAFEPATFGSALRLVGVDAPVEAPAGSMLYVTLMWDVLPGLHDLPVALSSSLRLYDGAGILLAQADGAPPMPTNVWEVGSFVRTPLAVGVPASAAAGEYALDLILYRQDDAAPLPLDDVRAIDGQRLRLGTVAVVP